MSNGIELRSGNMLYGFAFFVGNKNDGLEYVIIKSTRPHKSVSEAILKETRAVVAKTIGEGTLTIIVGNDYDISRFISTPSIITRMILTGELLT
jgi:hypothetical protein